MPNLEGNGGFLKSIPHKLHIRKLTYSRHFDLQHFEGKMADGNEDDAFNAGSAKFIGWLNDNGTTISSKVQLADLRHLSAGRGVITVADIAEDEELFSIPRLSILTAENSTLSAEVRTDIDDPWLSLILAMTFESQLGKDSTWVPYFDILPNDFDTLMYWTEAELKWLEGSTVIDKIGKQTADRTFSEQLIPIVRKNDAIFKAGSLSDDELLAMFHRMGSIIMAYAFDLEDSTQPSKSTEDEWEEDSDEGQTLPKGMVPLADMLNADADRNNAKLFYEEDRVAMKSIKSVKKGEELFNDYGPLPRADVLRRYGYVTDEYAKYDVVEISLDLVKQVVMEDLRIPSSDLDARIEYLEEQGVAEDGYDIGRASEEQEPFSEALVVLLNGLSVPTADFEKLKKKEKLPKTTLSSNAAELLHRVLLSRQSHYPNHLDEGLDTRRRRMALNIVEGERTVLLEAIHALNDLLGTRHGKRSANSPENGSENQGKRQKTG